jgi:hypothetical protein
VAATVTAATVDSTDESTLGCAHDGAASPRAIASQMKVLDPVGTALLESGMMSPRCRRT